MLEVFHSKIAQSVATWLAIFAAVYGVLAWLTPEWFGALTIPQRILLGAGLSLATGLALSVMLVLAAFGYRLVRPLPTPPQAPITLDQLAASGVLADVQRLREQVDRIHASPELDHPPAAVEEELAALHATVAKLRFDHDRFRANFDPAVGQMLAPLRDAQKEAGEEYAKFKEIVERSLENTWRKIDRRCRGIDQGFAAIFDRERLLEMAFDITNLGDELAGPSNGRPLGDWKEWQAKFTAWNRIVEEWARLADTHRAGVIERVFDTPSYEYKSEWGADYTFFPDHNAVHDYKTFCILSRNFHVERKNVDYVLMLAAFRSPSVKYRGDPEGGEDLVRTLPPPPEDYRD